MATVTEAVTWTYLAQRRGALSWDQGWHPLGRQREAHVPSGQAGCPALQVIMHQELNRLLHGSMTSHPGLPNPHLLLRAFAQYSAYSALKECALPRLNPDI